MSCLQMSGSKLLDTLIVFLNEFFEKVASENNQQTTKKQEKFPRGQRNKYVIVQTVCVVENFKSWLEVINNYPRPRSEQSVFKISSYEGEEVRYAP